MATKSKQKSTARTIKRAKEVTASPKAEKVTANPKAEKVTANPKAKKVAQERALIAKCEKIKKLELTATSDECTSRYAIGVEIALIRKDKKTYGEGAVEKIAAVLGRDANTLYDYGKVAKAWENPSLFETDSKKPNKNGVPLSFSHFIALAAVEDVARRGRLLNAALADSLSVSALKEKINPKKEEKPVAVFNHFVASVTTRINTWQKDLNANLNGVSASEIATLTESCESAAKALHAFANTLRDQGGHGSAPAGGLKGPVSTSPKDADIKAAV